MLEIIVKLLNSFVSPFSARVRMAIYAYDMPVEIAPSGLWGQDYVKSPDFLALHPIGRVPVLILDDGSALPESGIIVEHLACAFPGNGLRPAAALSLTRARLIAQIMELYVQQRAGPMFGQLMSPDRDPEVVRSGAAALNEGLAFVEHFWDDGAFGPPTRPTLADCVALPLLYFCERMMHAFAMPPIIPNHRRVSAYWDRAQSDVLATRVFAEMREAIADSPLRMLVE